MKLTLAGDSVAGMASTTPSLRCSPAVRALGHAPIGTAPLRTSFLLLDVPLPWGRDLAEDPALAPVLQAIDRAADRGERWRLQGIVPPADAPQHRVIAHHLPPGAHVGHRRHEVQVTSSEVIEVAAALVDGPLTGPPVAVGADDLLVCTHGRRDACCGSNGTSLWKELRDTTDLLPATTRLHRTSHTGGHRFAPTAIHLPSATSWAWLDAATVRTIARRDAPFATVAHLYRGSCSLSTPAEQVAEQAVLREVDWPWLDCRRQGAVVADGSRHHVELAYVAPDGTAGVWSAEVVAADRVPVPACGAPVEQAPKYEVVHAIVPGTLSHRTESESHWWKSDSH